MRKVSLLSVLVVAFAAPTPSSAAEQAPSHRARCHQEHSCPSDHATYRWRKLLCVAPYSDKRNSSFRQRVRYDGRTYYCKR